MRAWGAVVAGVLGLMACASVCAQTPQATVISSNWQPQLTCKHYPRRPGCENWGMGGAVATPAPVTPPETVVSLNWQQQLTCKHYPRRPGCELGGAGPDAGRDAGSPPSVVSRERAGRAIGLGAAAGGVGGMAFALSTCPPFLFGGPPLYAVCAVSGMYFGFVSGALAGAIVNEVASKLPATAPATAAEKVVDESFDQALARAAREKEHSAVALAAGDRKWAWGVAGGMATQDEARWRALDLCNQHAARDNVHAACVLYQLDGQHTELVLK